MLDSPEQTNFTPEEGETEEVAEERYKKAKKKYKSFQEKQAKAMNKIFNSVSESLQPMIEDCQTPDEAIEKLKSVFGDTGAARGNNTTQIRAELAKMEYNLGDGIDSHFAKVQRMVNALFEIDGRINGEEIITYLFMMAPPESRPYQATLRETLNNQKLTYQQVMERFRTEILQLERDMDREEAMVSKSGKGTPRRAKGKYCNFCKKPGHVEDTCFKKDPKKKAAYDKKRAAGASTPPSVKKRPSDSNLLEKATKSAKTEKKQSKRPIALPSLDTEDFESNNMAEVWTDSDNSDEEEDASETHSQDANFMSSEEEDVYFVRRRNINQSFLKWLSDSGCTKHMAANRQYFVELKPIDKPTFVKVGNGAKIVAEGIGNVVLDLIIDEKGQTPRTRRALIKDVLYVPGLMTNLLSIRQFAELGISTTFEGRSGDGPLKGKLFSTENNKTLATVTLVGKQFILDMALTKEFAQMAYLTDTVSGVAKTLNQETNDTIEGDNIVKIPKEDLPTSPPNTPSPSPRQKRVKTSETNNSSNELFCTTVDSETSDEDEKSENEALATNEYVEIPTKTVIDESVTATQTLWHHRLGHPNKEVMKTLSYTSQFKGSETIRGCSLGTKTCRTCAEGKGHKSPHTTKAKLKRENGLRRITEVLEIVHADTAGPITPRSYPNGYRYFMLFVDDASSYVTVACLRKKCEGLSRCQLYRTLMENQTGRKMKRFKTDNGSEFVSKRGYKYYRSHGIIHEKSTPYNPAANGKVERHIRTIQNQAKCLMFTSGAPSYLWDKAVAHAAMLHNLTPSFHNNGRMSPFEKVNGYKPNLDNLRVWGCTAYAHVPKEKRKQKFEKNAIKCVHVGMKEESNVYQLWNPKTKKFFFSADVVMFDEADFSAFSKASGASANGLSMPNNPDNGVEKREYQFFPLQ